MAPTSLLLLSLFVSFHQSKMNKGEYIEMAYEKYLKKHQSQFSDELVRSIRNVHENFKPYNSNPIHYILSIYDPLQLYYALLGISITIIDDGGCPPIDVLLLAPMLCSMVDIECPEFDLCLSLASSDNCCATYIAQFTGDLDAFNSINLSSFSFAPASQIESVGFLSPGGVLASNGVSINGLTVTGGTGLTGPELTDLSWV